MLTDLDFTATEVDTKAPVLSLSQWARLNGNLTTSADVESHIHAGLRSAPQTKTYNRWNTRRLAELQAARDETTARYRAEVAAGRVKEPPPATLARIAAGCEDNAATQAAKRLMAKRAADDGGGR